MSPHSLNNVHRLPPCVIGAVVSWMNAQRLNTRRVRWRDDTWRAEADPQ
jgi:hypothetical protein